MVPCSAVRSTSRELVTSLLTLLVKTSTEKSRLSEMDGKVGLMVGRREGREGDVDEDAGKTTGNEFGGLDSQSEEVALELNWSTD